MAYFPNGSSGEVLDAQCQDCPAFYAEHSCPVLAVQCTYNYEQLDKGNEQLRAAMNLLVKDDGECQVKKAWLDGCNDVDHDKDNEIVRLYDRAIRDAKQTTITEADNE